MTEQTKAEVVSQGEAERKKITITFYDVRKHLCPRASDQEIALFLKTCQSLNLNPFAREVYLVKYTDEEPAVIIIAIDAFLKAAEACQQYDGHEAGIILKQKDGALEFREGTFMLKGEGEDLVGGWAKVYRTDCNHPFYAAVSLAEYIKFTRAGKPTHFWREMPATMIRNVALRHALREAFPNRFAGVYSAAEIEPAPDGTLPPAYTRNGEPDWSKFWAMQREKGLSQDEVHSILGVSSVKDDWVGQGRTLEEAEETINNALDQAGKTKVGKPVRDTETIKTVSDLFRACHEDWGLQPKQVLEELGVSSSSDIAELPSQCYKKLARLR